MTDFQGNAIAYGSGAHFLVAIQVWDGGANTTSSMEIHYQYRVFFSGPVSDSSNVTTWSDPAGSGTISYNYVTSGAANITPIGGADNIINATTVYGGGTFLDFSFSLRNIAGTTGTSSVSVHYPIPARIATPPSKPATPTVQDITTTSATLLYVDPADNGSAIDGRQIHVQTVAGVILYDVNGGGSPRYVTGLVRANNWNAYFRASNAAAGWGAWSDAIPFSTPPDVPVLTTSYAVSSVTRNSALLGGFSVSDNGGESPGNLRVEYNTTASSSGASVHTQGSWSNPTISGLAALTTYYYRAAAWNSAGWGAYPATWKSFTTLADAPNDMAVPTFSAVTDTSMRATWVAPAMNGATFTAYRYELSLVNTFTPLITSGTTTALFMDFTGLTPGTRYYLRVRANATPNNGGYGTGSQLLTGVVPNSGMRTYACIGGVIYRGDLYTFVGGVRKLVLPMYAHGAVIETD